MPNTLKPVVYNSNVVTSLSSSFQILYTVPSLTTFTIGMVHIFNSDAVNRGIYLCFVPSGGTAQQSNGVLWNFTISPQDTVELLKGAIIPAGYTIQARSDTNSVVNIFISGIEST